MSKYSGKCDFCDEIENFKPANFSELDVRIGNNEPIKIDSIKDCIPYFTHIIASCCCFNGRRVINLDKYSWLRRERERYGVLRMHSHYKKDFNKLCKDNGLSEPYTDEECNPDFFSKTDKLGTLFLVEKEFLKYKNKFATVCKDKNNNLYILLGSYSSNPNKFLICKTTKENIEKVKEKSLSLKDCCISNSDVYYSHYDIDKDILVLRRASNIISDKYFF